LSDLKDRADALAIAAAARAARAHASPGLASAVGAGDIERLLWAKISADAEDLKARAHQLADKRERLLEEAAAAAAALERADGLREGRVSDHSESVRLGACRAQSTADGTAV
jgi:hypothetical protein